jgi:death-on-curing protein
MRYLEINEVIEMYLRIMEQFGGSPGIRDRNALDSALIQPQMAFSGQELYPSLVDKAAALGFSLVLNHPFVDGNKRIGHASLEKFLILNASLSKKFV